MFCNKCGKQIPDTSKYCKFCGGKVENEESTLHSKLMNTTILYRLFKDLETE